MTTPVQIPSPVPNRQLGPLDIIDGAFGILRGRPRTVATIAAAIVLPVQLLIAWIDRRVISTFNFNNFNAETGQFEGQDDLGFQLGSFTGGSLVGSVLGYMILPFMGVALTHLVLGWRRGEDPTAKECLMFTLRRAHLIVLLFVVGKIIQICTLTLTTPMTMLIAPVLAAEGLGPINTIKRVFRLGKRRYGQLLALLLLIVVVHVCLGYALLSLPLLISGLFGDWGWIVFFALSAVGATTLNLLGAGAAVFAYIDLRNRTEGADLTAKIAAARVAG